MLTSVWKNMKKRSLPTKTLYPFVRKSNTAKEAAALGKLGIACSSFGQYEQAIDDREKSLAIDREIKHRQGETTSLNNIGTVYRQLQQTEKAIKKYQGCQYLVGCG